MNPHSNLSPNAPVAVLVTGYARAGKDTFSHGILESLRGQKTSWVNGINKGSVHINFATFLKDLANRFMIEAGIGDCVDFHDEEFKVKHRKTLVEMGRFARSLDKDIFASRLANNVKTFYPFYNVVVSDWRYLNEYDVLQKVLKDTHRIITVKINTEGLHAANEEEGVSIGQIVREVPLDAEFTFLPDSKESIVKAGQQFGRFLFPS